MAVCVIALALAPAAHASDFSLELTAPPSATYGDAIVLRGRVIPALADAPVTVFRDGVAIGTAATAADGTFALRAKVEGPAVYSASAGELVSASARVAAKPRGEGLLNSKDPLPASRTNVHSATLSPSGRGERWRDPQAGERVCTAGAHVA